MARTHRNGKLSVKKVDATPQIFLDKDNNFASIRLGKGIKHSWQEH